MSATWWALRFLQLSLRKTLFSGMWRRIFQCCLSLSSWAPGSYETPVNIYNTTRIKPRIKDTQYLSLFTQCAIQNTPSLLTSEKGGRANVQNVERYTEWGSIKSTVATYKHAMHSLHHALNIRTAATGILYESGFSHSEQSKNVTGPYSKRNKQ